MDTRSESGFALIEVIVAAAVLAIVALAVLSGIDAASSTSAREKARAVAASLAERDQERLRAMTYEQIQKVHPSKPETQQPPTNVDGVTYVTKSEVKLVTDDIGGTPECGDEGTQVTYVHITSTVTSTTVGTRIAPVKVDSLIPPTQKWAEAHGTLGVKVVDRSATQGVRNIAVNASSTAYTAPQGTTDQNGCVVFKDIPVGTYTIKLNTDGYIDRDGNAMSQVTTNVVAKKVVFATMSYDVADTVTVDVVTHTPGKAWGLLGVTRTQPSKARKVSTINGANVGMLRTATPASPSSEVPVNGLFPFAENSYAFFTGGCRYESPDKVTTMTGSSPLYPNYFSTNNGVNPAAAVLADPAVPNQRATVRQPPFNIRVDSTRSRGTFSDGTMRVWATLLKPNSASTDSCSEARFELTTKTYDQHLFGTLPGANAHYVSQIGPTFDPGMPFGSYQICLRDTALDRGTNVHFTNGPYGTEYDNTNPDGASLLTIEGDRLSWSRGACDYTS